MEFEKTSGLLTEIPINPFILRTQLHDPHSVQNYDNFFNNTLADFVLISADLLLKIIIILIELRIAQLCS